MPEAESESTCPLCSKPIRAGMGTARVGSIVAHLRCLVRQNGLRALELQDRAAELVRQAQQAVVERTRLRAESEPTPFSLAGRITALNAATRRVTVGVMDLVLASGVPIEELAVGLSVIISCYRVRDAVFATEVRRLRPTPW